MSLEKQQKMDEKWFIPRKRHVPCIWPIHTYWAWSVHKYFGVPTTGKVLSIWEDGYFTAVFDKQKTGIDLGNAITDKIFAEANDLKGFREKGIKAGENTVTFCKEFSKKSENSSISEFIDFLNGFTKNYVSIIRDNMFYWVMGSPIIEKMIRKSLSSFDSSVVDEIFQIMTVPIEMSYSSRIDSELKKICDMALQNSIESVKEDIKIFSLKYFWFPYEYVGPGIWDEKTVTGLIETDIKKSSSNHFGTSGSVELQNECVKKYSLSQQIVELFKILQTLALMSDDRKRYNSEICYYLN